MDFCRWLREYNTGLPYDQRVGWYGVDVYSLWESLRAVIGYLAEHWPADVDSALEAYRCFEPYGEDPQAYAWDTRLVPEGCVEDVLAMLTRMRDTTAGSADSDGRWQRPGATQNAEVVAGADRYYRSMIGGGPAAWNVRDVHMTDTLGRLLAFHGPSARAVVWAHNTHAGDARGTDMPAMSAPMRAMPIPSPRSDSLEALLTETALACALFVFADQPDADWLTSQRGHRAIGVVYDPDRDRRNCVPTRLAERYDALCWITRTSAPQPLHLEAARRGELEALPSGV